MIAQIAQRYSLDEYRALAKTGARQEFHDGEIKPLVGGTLENSQISGNLYAWLKAALRGSDFKAINSDLRVWIPQHRRGLYPDAMVIQGQPKFNGDRRDEILNPSVIIEVLSNSTEAYDRGDKLHLYRAIPSFCEYILINQHRPYAEQYCKTDAGDWLMRSYEGINLSLPFQTLGVEISGAELYEDISFISSSTEHPES